MWASEAPCSSISKNQMKSLKLGHHIAKILLFRNNHLWNSTTELILQYTSIENPLHRQSEKACMCFKTRRVRTRDFTVTITWKSHDNTGAFMQEGLFKKDFTPLRVIQKSKLVSQPKGSFIGATPRADVLLLFPTDLYVKCHSDFSSKKTFFSLLFLRIYWNTIWLTKWRAMEKK